MAIKRLHTRTHAQCRVNVVKSDFLAKNTTKKRIITIIMATHIYGLLKKEETIHPRTLVLGVQVKINALR